MLSRSAGFLARTLKSPSLAKAALRPRLFDIRNFRSSAAVWADIETIMCPTLADSISDGIVADWMKGVGDQVQSDEPVCSIETDKVNIDVNSPKSGTIVEHCVPEGERATVGKPLFKLELGEVTASTPPPKVETPAAAPEADAPQTPAKAPEAPQQAKAPKVAAAPAAAAAAAAAAAPSAPAASSGVRSETRVKMTRMRLRIAERLKDAQNTAAMLTTFNEVDMSGLMAMRNEHKATFEKKHGIKFGFMSAFVKASVAALQQVPAVNAVIDGDEIVYRDYIDVSVAVATPKGLVVPVLRNCQDMSFADVEKGIAAMGEKARAGKLALEDMSGGTFSISNGGVYGSLMGTPILNPPQSAILGMHGIKERPVAINGKVEIRPMMYVALTYDHRIIDGREAVTALKAICDAVSDPRRLLLDI